MERNSNIPDFVISYTTGGYGEPRTQAWAVSPRAQEACEVLNINQEFPWRPSILFSDNSAVVSAALSLYAKKWGGIRLLVRNLDAQAVAAEYREAIRL